MSSRVLSGGRVSGGTASRASVCKFVEFTFIGILKIDDTPKTCDFSTTCGRQHQPQTRYTEPPSLKARRPAPIFLELLQVKRFVFRIAVESAVDRVARITHRD